MVVAHDLDHVAGRPLFRPITVVKPEALAEQRASHDGGPGRVVIPGEHTHGHGRRGEKTIRAGAAFNGVEGVAQPEHAFGSKVLDEVPQALLDLLVTPQRHEIAAATVTLRIAPMQIRDHQEPERFEIHGAPGIQPDAREHFSARDGLGRRRGHTCRGRGVQWWFRGLPASWSP